MSAESGVGRVAAERVPLPPIACSATYYWDNLCAVSRSIGPHTGLAPVPPSAPITRALTQASVLSRYETATRWNARPSLTANEMCLVPSSLPRPIDWDQEAAQLIFYVDPGLLLATARHGIPGATGALVWVCRERQAQSLSLYVHPVLLVQAADASLQADHVEIVPYLQAGDPLRHHIMLVLQATLEAEGVPGRLYAESLTNALAVHLLRRYATCRPPAGVRFGGLSTPKLRRTMAYIEAHLAHEVSLTELAAVAQTSPSHFARLFRHATGQTPHQYMIMCRIERAKQLLRETELPIIEISCLVGFTDQSYFTAVFRKHVSTTPKVYRGYPQR
jgi:AraC-like DNA-binding protein